MARRGALMEPNSWPLDPVSVAALVVRVIDDIDTQDEVERRTLLSDLACAAWGSSLAQSQ